SGSGSWRALVPESEQAVRVSAADVASNSVSFFLFMACLLNAESGAAVTWAAPSDAIGLCRGGRAALAEVFVDDRQVGVIGQAVVIEVVPARSAAVMRAEVAPVLDVLLVDPQIPVAVAGAGDGSALERLQFGLQGVVMLVLQRREAGPGQKVVDGVIQQRKRGGFGDVIELVGRFHQPRGAAEPIDAHQLEELVAYRLLRLGQDADRRLALALEKCVDRAAGGQPVVARDATGAEPCAALVF